MLRQIIRGTLLGILLSVIMLSCSSKIIKLKPNHEGITPELEKYRGYVHSLSEGRLGTKDFTLGFIKQPANNQHLLGVCTFTLSNLNKEIDIVRNQWHYLTRSRKLILVAHEYIHCECNVFYHVEDYYLDGCSKSIMHEYLPDENCVDTHMNDYLNEIRRGCGN